MVSTPGSRLAAWRTAFAGRTDARRGTQYEPGLQDQARPARRFLPGIGVEPRMAWCTRAIRVAGTVQSAGRLCRGVRRRYLRMEQLDRRQRYRQDAGVLYPFLSARRYPDQGRPRLDDGFAGSARTVSRQ